MADNRLYSAFFRGYRLLPVPGKADTFTSQEDSIMIRVKADSMSEAARIVEESRDEFGVPAHLELKVLVKGYGSPSML